ncbi:threonine-phosphate decarboxylase CobD [Solimonas variicoloris]|uniref:threonine-phosphate decarboxylase CobD n=1 Tax=Solimonas variicoloris TaxID=254408 RepID=UPI0005843C5B|nr:threonine-phosphate decarboxylase CobD [Solimonas variicoloris]
MLEHGGRVRAAAARYGQAPAQWLDLSTGLNPQPWTPPPAVAHAALAALHALPDDDDGLGAAAREAYGAELLPVAGSQAAIQRLPQLRPRSRVAVLAPMYGEHAHCWHGAGHALRAVDAAQCADAARHCEVLVVARPNNPDGTRFDAATLLGWHAALAARGGWLIVDEAFIDAGTETSLAAEATRRDGLIVLRSLGKFFGLAGARVGFVAACAALRARLADALGPWPLAGPSRVIAAAALRDRAWQAAARRRLAADAARLAALLHANGLAPAGGCALFQWCPTPAAPAVHEALARRAVLTRLYAVAARSPAGLRFGLPPPDGWARLDAALHAATREALAA